MRGAGLRALRAAWLELAAHPGTRGMNAAAIRGIEERAAFVEGQREESVRAFFGLQPRFERNGLNGDAGFARGVLSAGKDGECPAAAAAHLTWGHGPLCEGLMAAEWTRATAGRCPGNAPIIRAWAPKAKPEQAARACPGLPAAT